MWVKVSLHANLDYDTKRDANGQEKKVGISRVQTEKKAHRSALVNSAFRSTGAADLQRHALEFMAEPASFVPGDIQYRGRHVGFDRATIFRELPTSLTSDSAKKFIPAFAFIRNLKQTSDRNNVPVMDLVKKGLMERLQQDFPRTFTQLKNDAIRREPGLRGDADKVNRKAVEHVFDDVAREQFCKITGIEIPIEKWGFGQDKGLNHGLGKLRTELCLGQCGLDGQPAQAPLKNAWNRLRPARERKADERTFVRGTPKTFHLIGNNVIEGIGRSGKSVGYAILTPADVTQLQGSLRAAGVQPQRRTRVESGLSRYATNPAGIRASYGRAR